MHVQRDRLTAIRSANQLDGFDQPFRMIEMAMRQHQGLNPPEIEVHMPAIPLEGIGIRARIEEHGAGLTLTMGCDRQAQPMLGRKEPSPASSVIPASMRTRTSEATCLGRLESISVVLSTTTWTVSLSTRCIGLNLPLAI